MNDRDLHVLPNHECWQLLRDHEVGRLAVVDSDRPMIFPINYVVDHGSIVFRTAEGSKLAALASESTVAFEIDGWTDTEAFSVIVQGRGLEIGARDDLFDPADLPLFPWHASPKHHFVRIEPDTVTGRRFHIDDRRSRHTGDPASRRRAAPE